MTHAIGIYLFEEVEVLDFAGPFEVFTTAARMAARIHPEAPPVFRVVTIGQTLKPVRARAGLKLEPDYSIDEHPRLNALIVPGGVVDKELRQKQAIEWIGNQMESVQIVASVCTGAFLLAETGRLSGREVTTHWEDAVDLQRAYPALRVRTGCRWIDQGDLVTSAGISAGIDMSLHLVERLENRELALRTARQMDFAWTENAATPL